MSLAGLMVYEITLQRRSADEDYDTAAAYGTTTTLNGWMDQTASREVLVGGDRVITDALCILPVGTEVGAHDQIVYDGKTYDVVGDLMVAAAPESSKRHVELDLKHVSG